MKDLRYLALLRGINVGGKNIIKMTVLKSCFEGMGFHDVVTYIQSGNVIFSSSDKNAEKLTEKIEKALSKKFDYNSRVVVVTHDMLRDAVKSAPKGFGTEPGKYRYDVIFLKPSMTAKEAMRSVSTKPGVCRQRGTLFFPPYRQSRTEQSLTHHPKAGIPIHDHSQLEHHDQTTCDDGRKKQVVRKG